MVIGANSTVLSDAEDNMKCYGIVNGGGNIIPLFTPTSYSYFAEVA